MGLFVFLFHSSIMRCYTSLKGVPPFVFFSLMIVCNIGFLYGFFFLKSLILWVNILVDFYTTNRDINYFLYAQIYIIYNLTSNLFYLQYEQIFSIAIQHQHLYSPKFLILIHIISFQILDQFH